MALRDMTIVLLATTATFSLLLTPIEAGVPQWERSRELCRQLRVEGWKPRPDGAGDPATGEVHYGRALKIFVCDLRQTLSARPGAKPAHVDLFVQHGGGEDLTLSASFWSERDRAEVLDAAARTLARVARDLNIALPPEMLARVRKGDDSSWDELEGLRFDPSTVTREGELRTQPDLKPADVPLGTFILSIKPKDDN